MKAFKIITTIFTVAMGLTASYVALKINMAMIVPVIMMVALFSFCIALVWEK